MIPQIVARAKLFAAQITCVGPLFMFAPHMAAQVGRAARPITALLAQEPSAKVQSSVRVQLAWVAETFVANIAGKVSLITMAHQMKLKILPLHEPFVTRST